jgi:hypothetical protein
MRPVSGMAAVPAMHEQMNDRARQQEHVGQRAEKVSPMFFPEEKAGNRQKRAESQP